MRLGLRYLPKPVALIEPVGLLILQGYRRRDALAALVGLTDDITQDSAADPTTLIRRLDLYLAYFDRIGLIKDLDHARALPVNLDDRDVPAVPALPQVTSVTPLSHFPKVAMKSSR